MRNVFLLQFSVNISFIVKPRLLSLLHILVQAFKLAECLSVLLYKSTTCGPHSRCYKKLHTFTTFLILDKNCQLFHSIRRGLALWIGILLHSDFWALSLSMKPVQTVQCAWSANDPNWLTASSTEIPRFLCKSFEMVVLREHHLDKFSV